jgi:hypothetical protein
MSNAKGQVRRRGQGRTPIIHGTVSGYDKHLRRAWPPCAECTEAKRLAQMIHREKIKEHTP